MTDHLGAFRKVDPALLDDDPFWRVVRRRHPALEVVLIPTEPPLDVREEAADTSGENEVRARAAVVAVREVWRSLRPMLLECGVVDPPSVKWTGVGGRQSLVIQKAASGIGLAAGTDLLRELVFLVAQHGWAVDPGVRDHCPTLRATDGEVAVEAVAGQGATVVTITGPPVVAVPEMAGTLRDEVRAEVSSWR